MLEPIQSHLWVMALFMLTLSLDAMAACPGTSVAVDLESIAIDDDGTTTTLLIGVDPSAGTTVDVCSCQNGGFLHLVQQATTVPASMKMFLSLAMEAKALNKQITYHGTGCLGGSGSGYVLFSQVAMEP